MVIYYINIIVGIKSLLEVTAAKVCVTAAKQNLVLLINAAGIKLQLLKGKDCLKIKITYEIRIVTTLNQDNRNRESSRRSVPVDRITSNALISCDGLGGYDWSNQAEEGSTNYALMAYSTLSFDSEVSDNEEEDVHQAKIEKKIVKSSFAKIKFVKPKQQEKTIRKPLNHVEKNRQNTHAPRGNQRN
ncbi:hypothetical protein Tco_0978017 [Tanacetum coccineum]|uniref:Uncharacterized protein n=1 Tax=Tanacetum coccineum TaxID=301880 RepID=A0ABQ5ELU7_9ASTR